MDNRQVDVISRGQDGLNATLSVLMGDITTVTHFVDLPKGDGRPRTLILLRLKEDGSKDLPVALDLEGVTDLVVRWLDALPESDRSGWSDIDGECLPEAWRVFTEQWGHVLNYRHAVAGIQGRYAWIGK